LNKHTCPYCGTSIARPETPEGSFKGMLSMHVKAEHPEKWTGPKGDKIPQRFR